MGPPLGIFETTIVISEQLGVNYRMTWDFLKISELLEKNLIVRNQFKIVFSNLLQNMEKEKESGENGQTGFIITERLKGNRQGSRSWATPPT